jgi:hypothetical protein
MILARVEAIDPFYNDNPSVERSEVAVYYYNAHYLNKLIFRKHGPLNNCYIFRMHCLNPLTDTEIINISYFAVESDNIGFDDLAEMEGSPLLSDVPVTSDLFIQSLAKVENTFVVEKYSAPLNSYSLSELPTPSEPKPRSGMYPSGSINLAEESSDLKSSSKHFKSVVKSEACLTRPSARIKLNPGFELSKTQQSLAPRSFSSNQLSLFQKMLQHSTEGLSLFSTLTCHSQKYQPISPKTTSGFLGGTSLTADYDADNPDLFLPSTSASSQNPGAYISEQGTFSKGAPQLTSTLDRVTEEKNGISTQKFNDIDVQESSLFVGSDSFESGSVNLSRDLRSFSGSFSESSISTTIDPLKFKGLLIGNDDDFLQSPIIRLLFQANALSCEAAEILPAEIYIQDDDA